MSHDPSVAVRRRHLPSFAREEPEKHVSGHELRPHTTVIFTASWCAPGVLGVSPAKLGRWPESALFTAPVPEGSERIALLSRIMTPPSRIRVLAALRPKSL